MLSHFLAEFVGRYHRSASYSIEKQQIGSEAVECTGKYETKELMCEDVQCVV